MTDLTVRPEAIRASGSELAVDYSATGSDGVEWHSTAYVPADTIGATRNAAILAEARAWGTDALGIAAGSDRLLGGESPWIPVRKIANEARSNTAVLVDDSELFFPTVAGAHYAIRSLIFFDTNVTANFLYRWNHTGINAGIRRLPFRAAGGTAPAYATVGNTFGTGEALTGTGTLGVIGDQIVLIVGDPGGLFSFQWAQNTPNAGNTSLIRGSYVEYMEFR